MTKSYCAMLADVGISAAHAQTLPMFMKFHACLPDGPYNVLDGKTIPWKTPAPKCCTCRQKRRFSAMPQGLGWGPGCAKLERMRHTETSSRRVGCLGLGSASSPPTVGSSNQETKGFHPRECCKLVSIVKVFLISGFKSSLMSTRIPRKLKTQMISAFVFEPPEIPSKPTLQGHRQERHESCVLSFGAAGILAYF